MSVPLARNARPGWRRLGVALAMMLAGAAGAGHAAVKQNTNLPVQIDADALEIQQEKKVAVFTGNVAARQGDLVLRSDSLAVDYGSPKGDQKKKDGAPEISKLRAKGKVQLVSPTESARGDWAIYDVPGRVITMGGDVVLTRGDNVLQGRHLVFNLATGKSRIEGGTDKKTAGKAGSGRVRAVFNPASAGSGQ
jgi:lipopolysaccharide export system protein LptA